MTRYTHLDGTYHSFEELSGSPYAVLFWAEWCPYSRGLLEEVARAFTSTPPPRDFSLVAVSIDSVKDIARVKEWVGTHASHARIIPALSGNALDDEAYVAFGGNDLPHLLFVDKRGAVTGEGRSLGDLQSFIEQSN